MSHEHEGVGGMLDFQEQELTRMAGDNYSKREAMKMLAWAKPKAARRALINGLLQMNCNFIFCFRAKNSVKPVKVAQQNGGFKTEVIAQGFMPIAGEEFVFEMTMNALLLPGAEGVATWKPEHVGEKLMTKLPEQFRHLMSQPRAFDEKMGADLAVWARGGKPSEGRTIDGGTPTGGGGGPTTGPTLAERSSAFLKRVADATTRAKLNGIWAASETLRAELEKSDPEGLVFITDAFKAREDEIDANPPEQI